MKATDQIGAAGEDLRQLLESVSSKFDPRLGKAATVATAAILGAGAQRKELKKAGKQLRRKVGEALRYARKHPWETAALLAVTGAATMKAMETQAEGQDDDKEDGRPRTRRAGKASKSRRATRH